MSFTVHIWSSNVRPRVCHYQASLRALLCHKTESCCNLQIYSTVEHLFRLQSACQLILHSPVDVSWTNECWIIIRNEKRYFLFCFLFFLIRKYSKIILKLMFPSSQSPWQGVLIKWHCLGKYIIFKCYPEQHDTKLGDHAGHMHPHLSCKSLHLSCSYLKCFWQSWLGSAS